MDIIEKIEYLRKLGESFPVIQKRKIFFHFIPAKVDDGWIAIEEKEDYFSIIWTKKRDAHNRYDGPALIVDLNKSDGTLWARNGLSGAWKQALCMHPVDKKNENEIRRISDLMKQRISIAYDWQRQKG